MNVIRRLALATLAAPLALGLAACSDNETVEGEVPEGKAIAAITAPDGASWIDTITVTEENGYVMGNPDAPIKLMEYGSLTCGHCAAFAGEAFEPLRDKYVASGVVSYELRNQVQNGLDLVLARLVRCGSKESFHPLSEQVWTNLETIFENANKNPQVLESAMSLPEDQRFVAVAEGTGMLDFFATRGLSTDQAKACLADSTSVMAVADRSDKQSKELGITGTPTFFINGKNIGTQSWTTLEPMLQRAGAR